MRHGFKLPKWAVMIVAACLFCSLAVDWAVPGSGLHLASIWLGGAGGAHALPTWGLLVRLVGKNLSALTTISVCSGLVCVWLVAATVGAILDAAVRRVSLSGGKGVEGLRVVRNVAVILAGLAFALTPEFLFSSTRISPLMVGFVPYLAAAWLVVVVMCGGKPSTHDLKTGNRVDWKMKMRTRLLLAILLAFPLALLLVLYSEHRLFLARQTLRSGLFPAVYVWLAIGVAPALLIAWRVRKRHLVRLRSKLLVLGLWAVAIAVTGVTNITLGTLTRGRVASRVVAHILAAAEKEGRIAVVSDGKLDDLYFFMMPDKMRLISLARERDPAYGRSLADWVSNLPEISPSRVDDLSFAAELGPRILIDEWMKVDRAGFDSSVATVANVFTTRTDWESACGELKAMRHKEPLGDYLRQLLAVGGNSLGCRLLERGGDEAREEAWSVFRMIVDAVEPENYAAHLNLEGMIRRGYPVSQEVKDELAERRAEIEKGMRGWSQAVSTARKGGQIYVDPGDQARFVQKLREKASSRTMTPERIRFENTLAEAATDPKHGYAARAAIRKALSEGKVRSEVFGGMLVTLDFALGDVANAEKDAIEVLKRDRHDPTANAALGAVCASRADYKRAERYLRRALSTGRATVAAVNDLAYVCCRRGQLDEAESLARAAVKQIDGSWTFHETLASVLIRKGLFEEGERELERAEELVAMVSTSKVSIASIAIDRARLFKAKGDRAGFDSAIRRLCSRRDLTVSEKQDVEAIRKEIW